MGLNSRGLTVIASESDDGVLLAVGGVLARVDKVAVGGAPLPRGRPRAYPALSPTVPGGPGIEVVSAQKVPGGAMGPGAVVSRKRSAPQQILPASDRAAVVGIAASAGAVVADEVVQLHALGDGADFALVADPVYGLRHPVGVTPLPNHDLRVPLAPRPRPDVTAVCVLNPPEMRGPTPCVEAARIERREVARAHLAPRFRLRYARIRMVPNFRRQMRQRPSGARLAFVRRWPRLQNMDFIVENIARSRATCKGTI